MICQSTMRVDGAISDADGECTIQMLLDKADYYMYENKQSRKKSMQSTK